MYTVKQLSDLAGVSVRTLHYYDEIGLLRPSSVGENSYRHYSDDNLLQLQQILFFREMGLGLLQIKEIIEDPHFDLVTALQAHREALVGRIDRLEILINTIDSTIMHLIGEGEVNMSKKNIFEGFSEEKQKQYEEEAMKRYDPTTVRQSIRRWNSYTAQQKQQIKDEGGAVYSDLIDAMSKGPESKEVQAILARWHQHMRYFYEPTLAILRGLGNGYYEDPDFNATFTAMHPDLPAFLQKAITHYVDVLEKDTPELKSVAG